MPSNYELYMKLLADFEEVSRKLMHYQSNAYHWHDKVAYYEKAWAMGNEAVELSPAEVLSEPVLKKLHGKSVSSLEG